MRGIRIFKWVFLILGLAFIALATLFLINTRGFIAHAHRAEGAVVDMLSDRDGYTPVVRFRTPQGKEVTFQESGKQKPAPYAVGDTLQVLYLPETPADARIDRFSSLWLLPTVFGFLGAGFAGIGGGIILYGMSAARKKEYLLAHGRAIETDFQGVERNGAIEFNRKNPWRIASQWVNPESRQLRVFYSENLWFDPSRFVTAGKITVWLDPRNPKRYYMDV